MSIDHTNALDESLANLSIQTASMSLDSISESEDSDHELSESHSIDLKLDNDPAPFPQDASRTSREPSPLPEEPPSEDSVLRAYFESARELASPEVLDAEPAVSVIFSSHSNKHVFSRSWVSKRSLASVVEKPERLKSACLGVGLAQLHVPLSIRRSVGFSSLYSPHVEAVHGKDWATELYALCSKAAAKLKQKELEVPESWPYYDIYLAPTTVEALEGNVKAMETAVDEIFTGKTRRVFVVFRPPGHHCHEDSPSGFCIINNAHIAIQYAKNTYDITHAVILDCDLHHGDGTQSLLWKLGFKSDGTAELPMAYFSLHDINSFPTETNFAEPEAITNASVCFSAHNSAIWNVHLKPYEDIQGFNELYESEYSIIFRKAAEFLKANHSKAELNGLPFKPLIVISAGFDGSEFESQGMQRHGVSVPTSFYNRFSRDCVALAENYGQSYILSLMEGGYSPTAIATGAFSHLTGLAMLEYDDERWCPKSSTVTEVEYGLRQRWRMHPEKWTARGLHLGRKLFSIYEDPPAA